MKQITKDIVLGLKDKPEVSVVKYGITGCMPCLMAEETINDMDLSEVNLYTCDDVDYMAELNIESMPVIYVYGNGKEERINAYEVLDELEDVLTETIEKVK